MPPHQTKEGFYAGISIPVNAKLTEIFVQLHISEKSGRGVPRIVGEYYDSELDAVDNKIVDYCSEARSAQEILSHLGLKDRKSLMVHIKKLLERGKISKTIPDKPNSRNQKYITVK